MDTVIIYDTSVYGHHLEYLHHIYEINSKNDRKIVFVIPEEFKRIANRDEWTPQGNTIFDFIPNNEAERANKGNFISSSYRKVTLLRKYIRQYKATKVFAIMLMPLMPFCSFFLPSYTKISGIIYSIYLYNWNKESFATKVLDVIKYLLLSKSRSISKLFILNDMSAAAYLNKLFSTNKFEYIPDPVMAQDNYSPQNIRPKLGIRNDQKMFLHFGGLNNRKGTMDIVKAIDRILPNDIEKYAFVFAGKVAGEIKDEFYSEYDKIKKDTKIVVFDKFCSNQLIADMCYSCDVIIIPYKNTSMSSGVLGHAALYCKPVVGPSSGLLGKLIRKNRLGITIDDINDEKIYKIFDKQIPVSEYDCTRYVKRNNVESFQFQVDSVL